MTESPRPQENAATAQRLNDAIKRLRARLRTESGQHATGLSAPRLGVLAGVVREGPVTAARLIAAEHVSAQAIAQSLADEAWPSSVLPPAVGCPTARRPNTAVLDSATLTTLACP